MNYRYDDSRAGNTNANRIDGVEVQPLALFGDSSTPFQNEIHLLRQAGYTGSNLSRPELSPNHVPNFSVVDATMGSRTVSPDHIPQLSVLDAITRGMRSAQMNAPMWNAQSDAPMRNAPTDAPMRNAQTDAPMPQRHATDQPGALTTLASAMERARAGGRPLTIAQIGDSHVAFGEETAPLVNRLSADNGLAAGQVQFTRVGDVGKTATYANQHPQEFLRNINANTDLVVVAFGSNEAGAPGRDYAKQYAQLIHKIREKAPSASIVMVGPADGNYWNSERHLPYLHQVIEAQKAVAANVPNSVYVDMLPQMPSVGAMRANGMMRDDNLHLTQSGYSRLARILADDISQAET